MSVRLMRSFRSYIGTASFDSYSPREDIEWSNFWWDSANKEADKRYLLIGDSTIRMVRHTLADTIKLPVDMIGSSSNLDDILFVAQVDAFFCSELYRRYDAIFVQIGHHGRVGRDGGSFEKSDEDNFEQSLTAFLQFLSQFSDRIVVESIFDAVVPPTKRLRRWMVKHHFRPEEFDDSINVVTRRKNEIARSVAAKLDNADCRFKFLDINAIVASQDFLHVDHIHYEGRAVPFIVKTMMAELSEN